MHLTRRLFSTEIPPLARIGRALLRIPEEYKTFFHQNPEIHEIYDPNMKLILHLEGDVVSAPEKVLEIAGRSEIFLIIGRLKLLLKWGHFFWRLSDLSALNLEAIRVIRPAMETAVKGRVEMKIYWQLKVRGSGIVFVDGEDTKMNLKSLFQVQLHRFQLSSRPAKTHNTILYTGISRYVFETQSGFCTELHVERVEPKISGIDWKWRMRKVKFSEA